MSSLTSILKRPDDGSDAKALNVSFDLPTEGSDLVEYLKHLSSDSSYGKLSIFLKELSSPATEDTVLVSWFKQFKDNIYILGKENERIVGTILSMNWTMRGSEAVANYHELVLNLVSAHTFYLRPILLMILQIFSSAESEGNTFLENQSYQKAHSLLQDIVRLVPMAPDLLHRLIYEKFPYFKKPSHLVLAYSVNVLNACSYLPSYRMIIMEGLVDKFLQIDVHCPKETIETWEDKDLVPNENVASDEMAYPLARTLDASMQCMFNFIESTCHSEGGKLEWEETKKLYRELLTLFDKLVLPTFRCCHVQFLLFYICSLRPALHEGFLDYLWKKVKNPNTAPVRRQIASFYIGSLLARATYISINTVTACFDLMFSWVHSYINNNDSLSFTDISSHGTFHCVCQTLFYVFAFRHKEFINMKNGFKYLRSLNFDRIVTCRLNPLKFCDKVIVQNFASVARNYQIAYCYPVIERNNRNLLSNVDHLFSLGTFFPFDPYLLKRSLKWIGPIYRVYEADPNLENMDHDVDESFVDETDWLPDEEDDGSANLLRRSRPISPER